VAALSSWGRACNAEPAGIRVHHLDRKFGIDRSQSVDDVLNLRWVLNQQPSLGDNVAAIVIIGTKERSYPDSPMAIDQRSTQRRKASVSRQKRIMEHNKILAIADHPPPAYGNRTLGRYACGVRPIHEPDSPFQTRRLNLVVEIVAHSGVACRYNATDGRAAVVLF
jgi:hypothetical protein